MAKVIASDNYARESVADRVVAENLSQAEAESVAAAAAKDDNSGYWFYRVEPDDYRPWRGMEELV